MPVAFWLVVAFVVVNVLGSVFAIDRVRACFMAPHDDGLPTGGGEIEPQKAVGMSKLERILLWIVLAVIVANTLLLDYWLMSSLQDSQYH